MTCDETRKKYVPTPQRRNIGNNHVDFGYIFSLEFVLENM